MLRSKHFHWSDFTNSHNPVSWSSTNVVRRKLMLVTIGFNLKGLKQCLFGGSVRTIWNYWQGQIFFLRVRKSLFRIKSLLSRHLIDSFLQFFDSSLLFLTLVSEFRELLWGLNKVWDSSEILGLFSPSGSIAFTPCFATWSTFRRSHYFSLSHSLLFLYIYSNQMYSGMGAFPSFLTPLPRFNSSHAQTKMAGVRSNMTAKWFSSSRLLG